jgi:hypothetical protein
MTFTYIGSLATDLDQVRFAIQDKVLQAGPLPDQGNFSDEELAGLITREGDWPRAVAAAFEALEAAWSTHADIQVGQRREAYSQIAARYGRLADKWRRDHGHSAVRALAVIPVRSDGYSGDEGDARSGSEYT